MSNKLFIGIRTLWLSVTRHVEFMYMEYRRTQGRVRDGRERKPALVEPFGFNIPFCDMSNICIGVIGIRTLCDSICRIVVLS